MPRPPFQPDLATRRANLRLLLGMVPAIRQARDQKGARNQELAALLGRSKRQYQRVLSYEARNTPADDLFDLAGLLGIEIHTAAAAGDQMRTIRAKLLAARDLSELEAILQGLCGEDLNRNAGRSTATARPSTPDDTQRAQFAGAPQCPATQE